MIRHYCRRVLPYVAVVLAAVAGVAWLTILNERTHELAQRADQLSRQNSRLLRDFEKFRAVRIKQATETDLKLCEAVNTITRRDRQTFIQSNRRTADFLRLIGIPAAQIARVVAVSAKANAAELKRRPLLKCGQLPSVKKPKP